MISGSWLHPSRYSDFIWLVTLLEILPLYWWFPDLSSKLQICIGLKNIKPYFYSYTEWNISNCICFGTNKTNRHLGFNTFVTDLTPPTFWLDSQCDGDLTSFCCSGWKPWSLPWLFSLPVLWVQLTSKHFWPCPQNICKVLSFITIFTTRPDWVTVNSHLISCDGLLTSLPMPTLHFFSSKQLERSV